MCGIAGFVLHRTIDINSQKMLHKMAEAIAHRGPDEEGYFEGDGVYLAHRRLSIIDLKSGQQPMYSKNDKLVAVYNGEIYNFEEIRKELESYGYRFETKSDTEVLLKSYEEWGERCLSKFIGMFSFAIYDREKERLFFARDRLGIKPFYYAHDKNAFVFASEIKAILASQLIDSQVDLSAIDYFISLGYVPGENTMFRGIKKLKPGHCAILKDGSLKIKSYWSLKKTRPFTGTLRDAEERLSGLLKDGVALRMISDVPVGVFLSGGVDSAAIVSTVSGDLRREISTYTIGFRDSPELSELGNAKIISEKFGTNHYELILGHDDFFDSLKTLIHFSEEPLVEAAAIALFQLAKFSREHAIVLLSGEGADEVFAGYPLYKTMAVIEFLRKFMPSHIFNMLKKTTRSEKKYKYLDWMVETLDKRYKGISNDVTSTIKKGLYREDFLREYGDGTNHYFYELFKNMDPEATDLQKMQYVDIKTWLPDDLLLKADKMTMAASIELRVPFLDHRIVEFGYSLPDNYKINGAERKFVLKKVMEKYLPKKIIYQKKKGFPVPISQWFRYELHDKIKEILLDSKSIHRGYFNEAYINKVLSLHRRGTEDLSRRILSLLILELWHHQYSRF